MYDNQIKRIFNLFYNIRYLVLINIKLNIVNNKKT